MSAPIRQIALNAGLEGGVVAEKVAGLPEGHGLNAATGEYGDMLAAGVPDPTKVVRSALQNAASIAALFLTTEAVIADKPEKARADGWTTRRVAWAAWTSDRPLPELARGAIRRSVRSVRRVSKPSPFRSRSTTLHHEDPRSGGGLRAFRVRPSPGRHTFWGAMTHGSDDVPRGRWWSSSLVASAAERLRAEQFVAAAHARRHHSPVSQSAPHSPATASPVDAELLPGQAAGGRGAGARAARPARRTPAAAGHARATSAMRSAATGSTPTTTAATSATTCCSATPCRGRRACSSRARATTTSLAGTWHDPYTGRTLTFTDLKDLRQAEAIQIDHVVPLAEAWVSGARRWSRTRREAFANDLGELLAVDGPTNMSKGDGDPASWRPRKGYQCTYARRWIAVKAGWQLAVDPSEVAALGRCWATADRGGSGSRAPTRSEGGRPRYGREPKM